ncbi:hypothetical protein ACFOSS_02555 [Pseudaeromonas sharmana]|uniref:Uncharacterized protein n=1 Tax=Pseudaeromonas sharmana TaxID=328412 RepID=A0ABV8CJE2_9GAMM
MDNKMQGARRFVASYRFRWLSLSALPQNRTINREIEPKTLVSGLHLTNMRPVLGLCAPTMSMPTQRPDSWHSFRYSPRQHSFSDKDDVHEGAVFDGTGQRAGQ